MFSSLGIVNPGMYLVGVIFIILAPGPNSLYVLATATRRSLREAYLAAAGVLVADSVLMLAASLGVDSLLRLYPTAFSAMQYAGAGFLFYLGCRALIAAFRRPSEGGGGGKPLSHENPFKRAVLLGLSNPKAILFFVSFFVQFVDPSKGHPALAFLVLALIVQLVSLSYLSLLIFSGSKLSALVRGRPGIARLGSILTGLLFIAIACRLAASAAHF